MGADEISNNLLISEVRELLDFIKTRRLNPPEASQLFAYVLASALEAYSIYSPKWRGTFFGPAHRRPALERGPDIAAIAALSALRAAKAQRLNPSLKLHEAMSVVNGGARREKLKHDANAFGIRVSSQIEGLRRELVRAASIQEHNALSYWPVNAPERTLDATFWTPLRLPGGAIQSFLLPNWGVVLPLCSDDVDFDWASIPPPSFASPEYINELEDVVHLTEKLSDKDKAIVFYWADGPSSVTPPGHWMLLASDLLEAKQVPFERTLLVLASMSISMFHAGILVWRAKRRFNTARPITAVRVVYRGKKLVGLRGFEDGMGEMPAEIWKPFQSPSQPTPPFAEYPSGHSAFSKAAATSLKLSLGSDVFGGSAIVGAGTIPYHRAAPASDIALQWDTFSAAADEAGYSRRLGGIHFESADKVSQFIGERCASEVCRRLAIG